MSGILDGVERNSPQRPRLKVFLSCDIVGSTAYKQPFAIAGEQQSVTRTIEFRRDWQRLVRRFYSELPAAFNKSWEDQQAAWGLGKTHKGDGSEPSYDSFEKQYLSNMLCGRSPFLWKTIGDEIIFWKELSHEHQLWMLINSWMESLAKIRPMLLRRELDLKSTIWLSEFPVRNAALAVEASPGEAAEKSLTSGVRDATRPTSKVTYHEQALKHFYAGPVKSQGKADFIGPGIDLGFRLSSLASSKRMMVSLDIAYLLALSHQTLEKGVTQSKVKMKSLADDSHPDGHRPMLGLYLDDQWREKALPLIRMLNRSTDYFVNGPMFDFKLNFSGSQPLKGVLGGAKYPIFWVNTVPADTVQSFKDGLYITTRNGRGTPARNGVEWSDLLHFCMAFYEDRKSYLTPPVIIPDNQVIENLIKDTVPGPDTNPARLWSATYQKIWFDQYLHNLGVVNSAAAA